VIAGRILLHSGGQLGPGGRAGLAAFLGEHRRVAFVTAANLHDESAYFERVRASLAPPPPDGAGLEPVHLRWDDRPLDTLADVDALFMGGGNTYALLARLQTSGLMDAIRERVAGGMPYAGASAGSNVAGPNILTTNDWNMVALRRFDALGLVPFNINPHYRETDSAMAAFSETRDDRIREYLRGERQSRRGARGGELGHRRGRRGARSRRRAGQALPSRARSRVVPAGRSPGVRVRAHTAIKAIMSPRKNIVTVEDPVEYRQPGIQQVQVKSE
jgi:dipeptidase E